MFSWFVSTFDSLQIITLMSCDRTKWRSSYLSRKNIVWNEIRRFLIILGYKSDIKDWAPKSDFVVLYQYYQITFPAYSGVIGLILQLKFHRNLLGLDSQSPEARSRFNRPLTVTEDELPSQNCELSITSISSFPFL